MNIEELTTLLLAFMSIYFFMFSFKIYKPRLKNEEQTERQRVWFEKFGKFAKVGSVVLLVLVSSLFLLQYFHTEPWTPELKEAVRADFLTSKTISSYPSLTEKTCDCLVEAVVSKMTVEEYKEVTKLPINDQYQALMPVIKNCVEEFKRKKAELDSLTSGP